MRRNMKNDSRPIGVFDSGIGGLTVLDSLIEKFPNENFIYIADQKYCPYGVKTEKEIVEIVSRVIKKLIQLNVKAIVIACNTASLFIEEYQKITDIPIISVIEPTAALAIQTTKNKKIGILGTVATIKKGKYQKLLEEAHMEVYPLACSEFVDFLENNQEDEALGNKIVHQKIISLIDKGIDTLIFGCTHFSLLEEYIVKDLGCINYIACGEPTSLELAKKLKEKDLWNFQKNIGSVEIYTTGNKEQAIKVSKWFSKKHLPLEHIDIEEDTCE